MPPGRAQVHVLISHPIFNVVESIKYSFMDFTDGDLFISRSPVRLLTFFSFLFFSRNSL